MRPLEIATRCEQLCRRLLESASAAKSVELPRNPDAILNDQISQDIDASFSGFPLITRPNAGPDVLLIERLRLLGIDPAYVAAAQHETLLSLQKNCTRCANWRQCARDLGQGNVQQGMKSYCVNAEMIDHLLVDKLRG
jgi:hypothetical protein